MQHKYHVIEIIIMLIAILVLIVALFFFNFTTQQLAYAAGNGHGKIERATSDNSTPSKAEILKQKGVPGKGIDKAPGLQKPFNVHSNAGKHVSDNSTSVSPGSDNGTMTKSQIWEQWGIPGKGISEAPGLQKAFNNKSDNQQVQNKSRLTWQHRFREMLQRLFKGEPASEATD